MYQSLRGVLAGLVFIVVAAGGALALPHQAAPAPAIAGQGPDRRGPGGGSPAPFWGQGELAFVMQGQLALLDAPHDRPHTAFFSMVLPPSRCAARPAWPADGRWLAFLLYECPHPHHSVPAGNSLALVGPDGQGLRIAFSLPGTVLGGFAWSPAGDRLAVAAASGGVWIIHVHPQSVVSTPLVRAGSSPRWSPDGRQIAFVKGDAVYTVPSAGGAVQQRYLARAAGIRLAGWWPDGRGLLFWLDPLHSASLAADGLKLYSLPLAGGAPRPLVRTLTHRSWLSWGPDGRLLVVAGGGRETWTNKRLAVCDVQAGACRSLPAPRGTVALDAAWSPGGRRIAFVSAPAGSTSPKGRMLWVENADGSGAHPVAGAGGDVAAPMWSRDGRRILYVRDDGMWIIPSAGGKARRVFWPPRNPPSPSGY